MRGIIFVLIFFYIYINVNLCFAGFLTSSVDDEAYAKGREYFSKRIVFCNGKYYMNGLSLIELEGLEFYINPGKISEADKKNGIEWSGRFSFEASTYRELNEQFEWGIYKDWNSQYGRLSLPSGIFDNSIKMLKLNGIWYLNEEPNKEKLIGLNRVFYDIQKKEEIKELDISCGEPPEYILGEIKKIEKEKQEKNFEEKYWIQVSERVRSRWMLPEERKWDPSLVAQVFVTINRNGDVVRIEFENRSRDPLFDQLVEKTIRSAAPMPPFPPLIQQETTEVGFKFKPDKR